MNLWTRFITDEARPPWSTVAAVQIEIAVSAIETRITGQVAVFTERSRQTFCMEQSK